VLDVAPLGGVAEVLAEIYNHPMRLLEGEPLASQC